MWRRAYQRDSNESKRFVELDSGVEEVGCGGDKRDVTKSFDKRQRDVQRITGHLDFLQIAN